MRPAPRPVLALLAAAAGVAGGCGSGVTIGSGLGPLHDTQSPASFCITTQPGRAVAVGWDLLQVTGTSPAVVKSVSLAGSSGLRLAGADVVPVIEQYIVGNGWSWPLTSAEVAELPHGVEWSRAHAAAGASVQPSSSPDVNLVAGIAATGSGGGSTTGLLVTYAVAGTTYELTTEAHVTVRVAPQHC